MPSQRGEAYLLVGETHREELAQGFLLRLRRVAASRATDQREIPDKAELLTDAVHEAARLIHDVGNSILQDAGNVKPRAGGLGGVRRQVWCDAMPLEGRPVEFRSRLVSASHLDEHVHGRIEALAGQERGEVIATEQATAAGVRLVENPPKLLAAPTVAPVEARRHELGPSHSALPAQVHRVRGLIRGGVGNPQRHQSGLDVREAEPAGALRVQGVEQPRDLRGEAAWR
mmetsp:Transcript_111574/g.320521  ORF Transcript_111574/g.320521 Transcript_111574/m.320521 type:complete len:229 (+) Transcript_111574:287-973(+)